MLCPSPSVCVLYMMTHFLVIYKKIELSQNCLRNCFFWSQPEIMAEKAFMNCSSSERSINTPGLSTVAVKYVSCLAQEHNTMTPGWAQTQAS